MKKLIIFLFSICISFNSYSGVFSETICFETDGQNIVFLLNETNPYTGKYLCKYDNGLKERQGIYKDGRMIGKWVVWYENGQKWYEGNFKDGNKDGKIIVWYENGQIKFESNYKDGECISGDCPD